MPASMEKATSAYQASPSLRCVNPLSKLLKFRSQFEELEDLSAQNSRTVKNLAVAAHLTTPK